MHGRGHAWQGECVAGGTYMTGEGACMAGETATGMHSCYHPRMRVCNVFGHVCLSVCLSVCVSVCSGYNF